MPLLVIGGYFSPQGNFIFYLFPFKYLSLFKWVFQLLIENEFSNVNSTCMNPPENCNPLTDYNFDESFAVDFIIISTVSLICGIIGFFVVYYKNKIRV